MTSTTASNVTLELAPPEKSNMVKNNKSIGTSNAVVFIACLVPSFVAVAAIGVAAAAWSRVNELKSTHLDTIITPAATAPGGGRVFRAGGRASFGDALFWLVSLFNPIHRHSLFPTQVSTFFLFESHKMLIESM